VVEKLDNYLKNYARRNRLTLAQERVHFFTKTHEKFLEEIPKEINKYIDKVAHE
jgi:hypothetical protein